MAMKNTCKIRVKGGERCGNPLLPGKKYCRVHIPKENSSQIIEKISKVAGGLENLARAIKDCSSSKTIPSFQYKEYIKSEEWKSKASAERKKNQSCSLCNRKGILHVHHRTYKNLGNEKPGDLIVLCSDCHAIFHENYEYSHNLGSFCKK